MEKRALSENALYLMHYLMADERIANKVKNANSEKEGRSYKIYNIRKNGSVVLGETRFRFINRILNCEYELQFSTWALAVWDALVDSSKGLNAKALEEGLSVEIVKNAQRNGNYEEVVERLIDCYRHVCNAKNGGVVSAGTQDNNGSNASTRIVNVNGEPIEIHINANGFKKVLRWPDATGKNFLGFDIGVTGVHVDRGSSIEVLS